MVKQWKRSLSQSDILSDGTPFDGAKIDAPISEAGSPPVIVEDHVFRDGWADNQLVSNRASLGIDLTRTYQNGHLLQTGIQFGPEWSIPSGKSAPSATNERLEVNASDEFAYVNYDIPVDLTNRFTKWEWKNVEESGQANGVLTAFAEQISNFSQYYGPHRSYTVVPRSGSNVRFVEVDDSGNNTELITGAVHTGGEDITLTRSPDGQFELFQDGISQGTASDKSHTNASLMVIGASQSGVNMTVGEVKIE